MKLQNILHKLPLAFVFCIGLITTLPNHASHGGSYHGHGGGGHGGGNYHGRDGGYRGHGGYYREDRGYWGGSWFGPAVVIAVPYGRRYYEEPYPCSVIERCYPNGDCVETEICE